MTNSLAANRQSAAMGSGVGPLLDPFPNVERIAVLRGGGLGDLMFAYPALSALSAAYPEASITLLGVPLHAELLRNRPGPVAEVEVLPYASGVRPVPPETGRPAYRRNPYAGRGPAGTQRALCLLPERVPAVP